MAYSDERWLPSAAKRLGPFWDTAAFLWRGRVGRRATSSNNEYYYCNFVQQTHLTCVYTPRFQIDPLIASHRRYGKQKRLCLIHLTSEPIQSTVHVLFLCQSRVSGLLLLHFQCKFTYSTECYWHRSKRSTSAFFSSAPQEFLFIADLKQLLSASSRLQAF